MSGRDPIEEYLGTLGDRLEVDAKRRRRVLREVRAHLQEAAARDEESGVKSTEARHRAVARFGAPDEVARRFHSELKAPPRRVGPRVAAAALACCAAAAGVAVTASLALERPVLGLLFDQERERVRQPGGGIVYRAPATTLVRIDARTLRPLGGLRLELGRGYGAHERSPDGSRLAIASYEEPRLKFVELDSMRLLGELRLTSAPRTRLAAMGWVRPNRLLVFVQQLSKPYRRYVVSRSLLVVDPLARRVISRRSFSKLRIEHAAVAGGRLVFTQADSSLRSPLVRLVVVDGDGASRAVGFRVGNSRGGGGRRFTSLAVEPSGERAFLAAGDGKVTEIALDSLRTRSRSVAPPVAPSTPGGFSMPGRMQAVDGALFATTGFFPLLQKGRELRTVTGVFRIDTSTWRARLVSREGTLFQVARDILLVYGYGSRLGRGAGLRAYDLAGARRYHLYGDSAIQEVLVAGDYLHTLRRPPAGARAVFDLRTGKNLGRLSRPPQSLRLLDPGNGLAAG